MAVFKYRCGLCGEGATRILQREPSSPPKCPRDGSAMERARSAPGTSVKEVLDNGLMSRPLERPADAERLFRERSRVKEDRG